MLQVPHSQAIRIALISDFKTSGEASMIFEDCPQNYHRITATDSLWYAMCLLSYPSHSFINQSNALTPPNLIDLILSPPKPRNTVMIIFSLKFPRLRLFWSLHISLQLFTQQIEYSSVYLRLTKIIDTEKRRRKETSDLTALLLKSIDHRYN
ncbi:hypothetical protein LENED_006564 [Lentinula edodes]|uniref:Uncharacterized protein n=1 Tax=Lentinula edodes TaxID=5353 RepID=A0A1Q3EC05_LENED|nr:hypothetical protein LENED_006564 [Lentinula edodes]